MGDAFGKVEDGSVRQDVLFSISSCPFTTFPNPSTCHRCGLRLIDRIQTFYSQWRIVLLCRECFARIRSAQLCSYCFSLFPESEDSFLDCFLCFRRVHRACVPLHHRNFSHSQLDAVKFFCIDCRPIPKLRRKDPKTSGCSASHATFMVPLISGAKSISEKKVALHAKPKENVREEKMVGMEFGAIQLVMEPSNVKLSVSNEKMSVLLHHQQINESDKISRSLFPGKEQCSCDAVLQTVDSDYCAHHSMIEDSTRNKSLPEDSLHSESMLASCPFNTGCLEDLILKETETSIMFLDSIDDGGNSSSEMLPCHSLNTWFNNAKPGDCDGEGSPKLQRKSIEAVGLDCSMKKYFRKRWSSGRIIQTNSQSILSNSRFCEPENLDLMKQTSVRSTDSPKNFSLQEKEVSLRFPDCMYAGINDGEGSPKLQRKSIEAVGLDCSMKKYFRKRWSSGRIIQTNSQSILSNSQFCEPENLDVMKQTSACSTDSPKNFSLQEKEGSLRFPDSMYAGSNDGEGSPKLQRKSIDAVGLDCSMKKYFRKWWSSGRIIQTNSHSILSNSCFCVPENLDVMKQTSVCSTDSPKNFSLQEKEGSLRFPDSMYACSNDGEGWPKLQRKSIEAVGLDCSMKKYFRKRRSSGIIIQMNSQPILSNSRFCEPENLDVMKQTSVCSTDSPKNFSLQGKEGSLRFPVSMYADSNDGEGSPKLQRKSIEAGGLDCSMKKYFRKRWSSGIIIQTNSQSILSNSRVCEVENLDVMKQTSVCSTNSPKNFSLQEKEGSLRFPDSMYAGNKVASASLPCHGMNSWSNSTMQLINCKYGDGDGEGSSTIQRSSIHGSGGIVQGKTESILTNGPLFNQNKECNTASSGDFFLKEKESPLKFPDCTDNGSNAGCALLPSCSLNDWPYRAVPITKYMLDVGDVDGPAKMQRVSNAIGYRPLKKYFRKHRGSGRIMQRGILNEI